MKKLHLSLINFAAAATLLVGAALYAADIDGSWIWTTPGRNGGPARESILSLKADGAQLSGKISTPGRDGKPVDTPISDGKVDGTDISFTVARVFNGNTNITSYHGTLANGQITGKIEFTRNGEQQSRDWTAKSAGDQTEAKPVTVSTVKPGYDENGHKIVNETHYKEISVDDAVKFLSDHPDAIIIDARSPHEFAAGHLPNAKNYDLTDDDKYKAVLETITDPTKWYLVHSAVGHYRTVRALEYFEAHNFEHVVAIDGGYHAWAQAGKPTIKEDQFSAAASK